MRQIIKKLKRREIMAYSIYVIGLNKDVLKEPKFITIDIVNNNVVSNEIEFGDVSVWKTVYWSRATKAWHNWMAVEPVTRIS